MLKMTVVCDSCTINLTPEAFVESGYHVIVNAEPTRFEIRPNENANAFFGQGNKGVRHVCSMQCLADLVEAVIMSQHPSKYSEKIERLENNAHL